MVFTQNSAEQVETGNSKSTQLVHLKLNQRKAVSLQITDALNTLKLGVFFLLCTMWRNNHSAHTEILQHDNALAVNSNTTAQGLEEYLWNEAGVIFLQT